MLERQAPAGRNVYRNDVAPNTLAPGECHTRIHTVDFGAKCGYSKNCPKLSNP